MSSDVHKVCCSVCRLFSLIWRPYIRSSCKIVEELQVFCYDVLFLAIVSHEYQCVLFYVFSSRLFVVF